MVSLLEQPFETLNETTPDLAQHVREIQERLFSTEDSVCLDRARLMTAADQMFDGISVPLKRAKCFCYILDHMQLDLLSNPVFAGNTSSRPRAWMLNPEFGFNLDPQGKIELDWLSHEWFEKQVPADIRDYWESRSLGGKAGTGHMSIDFQTVVDEGIASILERIERRLKEDPLDSEQHDYLVAMQLTCKGMIRFAGRYAEEAARLANLETDPAIAACLQRVAHACRRVPEHPARDYFEGLQAITLVHLATVIEGQGLSQSLGLLDRALARFADEVAEDMEASIQLSSAFLLKICANSFHGRMSKTQTITIGGAYAEGVDACNAVTLAFLNAYERIPVADPHVFFRWHEKVDPTCWQFVVKLLSQGRSMPMLVNDHKAVPGYLERGVAPKDAWSYCIIGCNEIGIPGKCCTSAINTGFNSNEANILHAVLSQDTGSYASTESIIEAFSKATEDKLVEGYERRQKAIHKQASLRPFPFTSCFCSGPVERGQDYFLSMPYASIHACYAQGTANAINALAAIDELVFQRGQYSLSEYMEKIASRDTQLLAEIDEAPKWGNDDDRVDALAESYHEARHRGVLNAAPRTGGQPIMVCHVIRSLHHLMGKNTPCTADGREAGSELGDSIGPICGTTSEGPTAILRSVAKLDAIKHYAGIYNFNFSLAGTQAEPQFLTALIEGFFEIGGQEIQVAVLNAEKLKAAKQNPADFQDIVVRIAGLNARFVELSNMEQDEIIRRAEAC